jgi:hypothetical protein
VAFMEQMLGPRPPGRYRKNDNIFPWTAGHGRPRQAFPQYASNR